MGNNFHIARFVVQAASPVMVSSGGDDPHQDNLLARDVNGLPMLPASSIVGVIKKDFPDSQSQKLFNPEGAWEGKLTFTDGLFHDSKGVIRDGIFLAREELAQDCVTRLALKRSPVTRDHVRLNSKGVVDRDGKFERTAAPAGSRFTFEISERGDGSALDTVSNKIREGFFIGGATRTGYGKIICVQHGKVSLDLEADREKYLTLAKETLESRAIKMHSVQEATSGISWKFSGNIEGGLLIGAAATTSDFDRSYFTENQIEWPENSNAVVREIALIPASSIKGSIRHRFKFHLQRLKHEDPEETERKIFGFIGVKQDGQAGSLRFSDIRIGDVKEMEITHVGLDRFTGGSRKGVLFSDQMIWRPILHFCIEPSDQTQESAFPCELSRQAFAATLKDLKTGRLGLGADWGDGLGIFETLSGPFLEADEVPE